MKLKKEKILTYKILLIFNVQWFGKLPLIFSQFRKAENHENLSPFWNRIESFKEQFPFEILALISNNSVVDEASVEKLFRVNRVRDIDRLTLPFRDSVIEINIANKIKYNFNKFNKYLSYKVVGQINNLIAGENLNSPKKQFIVVCPKQTG